MCAQRDQASRWAWLHDDQEEDLVGADWHQRAIRNLSLGLLDLAAQEGWPWHVGDQLTLVAWKPDGTPWRPAPDIMVHPLAGPELREEIDARREGVPALIIEVASPSTVAYDLDAVGGKAAGYLHLGVANYLVFDPTGRHIAGGCQGWQMVGGRARAWLPVEGRYVCEGVAVAFQPEGPLLRILDPRGHPVLYDYEKSAQLATLSAQLSKQNERIAALEEEVARLRRLRGVDPDDA